MDTKKLRQKILDLAIHGKLVPQDPNDEPASVLLQRIREEKERLIKEGKIKQSKTKTSSDTPPYGNDAPFEVPDSWEWCKLSDVCHIVGRIGFRGYTKDDLVTSDGAITLSPSNIVDGKMDYSKCTYISWEKYEESPEIQIANGDILLVKTGSSFGKCAYVTNLPQKATINPQFVTLKFILCSPFFLTYILQSGYARKNYDDFVLGTAIPTFTQAVLGNMSVPLPPLSEQHRIVSEVERWFSLIDKIEKGKEDLIDAVRQAKAKILDLAIHGKLLPQNPNDEPATQLLKHINTNAPHYDKSNYKNLPQGWEICNLKDVCSKIVDGDHNPPAGESNTTNYLMLSAQNIQNDSIVIGDKVRYLSKENFEQCNKRTNITEGDLLVTIVGSLGRSCIYNKYNHKIALQRSVACLTTYINNLYLKFVIDSPRVQYFIEKNARGTAQKGFYLNQLELLPIPLPPLSEQQRIVSRVEELFARLDSIERSLE